jgi:hypothetical protein
MNVEQLRRALADLPGEMPVIVDDSKSGWMESAALYLAPAHIDRQVSGNYVFARHQDDADDCYALLVSGFDHFADGFVEISPKPDWPKVIDSETDGPPP